MSDFNFEQASYADLLAHAKYLTELLEKNHQELVRTQLAFTNRDRQRDAVAQVIEPLIENGVINDPEDIAILCGNLDLEVNRRVEFTITVQISGSMDFPYGESVESYGFDCDRLTYNGDYVEIDSFDVMTLDTDED